MKRVHRSLLTAAVFVVLGGAGAYLVWDNDLRDGQERRMAASEAKRLFRFGRDQVERGRIFTRGTTVAFARDTEWGWRLTSPVETPADSTAIEAAIDRMAGMRVDPVEGELARYELDHPEAWMEVETNSTKFLLLIGPKNEMTEQRFVSDGSGKVFLADPSFTWSIDRPLEAFREHRVVPLAKEKISGLASYSPRGLEWELKRTPEGWIVGDPQGAVLPADESELNFLFVGLTKRLRADDYLSEEGKLENWKRKLEITYDGGSMVLYLGEYSLTGATGAELVAAWIEGTSSVIQVGEWARKDFTKTVAELRDRTLSRFDRDQARRIEFWDHDKLAVAYERKDPETPWSAVGGGETIQTIPNGVLLSTSRLKAERVEKDHPTAEEMRTWELEPARRKIIVLAENRGALAEVRLGKRTRVPGSEQHGGHQHGGAGDETVMIMEAKRRLVGVYSTRLDDLFPAK